MRASLSLSVSTTTASTMLRQCPTKCLGYGDGCTSSAMHFPPALKGQAEGILVYGSVLTCLS